MEDLTVILCTPNKVPKAWAEYHKNMLLRAIGDTPVITISRIPLDWGTNLIQEGYGLTNLYYQVLRGAELATTPYIATVDDDTLYPAEHFRFRPPLDCFSYNLHRWHLFTWGNPFYFHKPLPGGGLMIAPRELAVKALRIRFLELNEESKQLPKHLSHELGTRRDARYADKGKWIKFYTSVGVVSFYHEKSVDVLNQTRRKKAWPIQAFDIPFWGKAQDIRKHFG